MIPGSQSQPLTANLGPVDWVNGKVCLLTGINGRVRTNSAGAGVAAYLDGSNWELFTATNTGAGVHCVRYVDEPEAGGSPTRWQPGRGVVPPAMWKPSFIIEFGRGDVADSGCALARFVLGGARWMCTEGSVESVPVETDGEKATAGTPLAASSIDLAPKRATLALELAGRALDPTAGPSAEIARALFREALIQAALATAERRGDDPLEIEDALGVLDGRKLLGDEATGAAIRAALAASERSPAARELRELELPITKAVQAALGAPSLALAERWRRWVFRLAVVIGVLGVVGFATFRYTTASFPYRVSSAHTGFPKQDYIGRIHAYGLVLHTQQQQDPWVEIDLEQERAISTIILKNRADCCNERGLPLIVEVAGPDGSWSEVGKRTETYDEWVLTFPPRQARYVRLRSTSNTVLHFREIQVK